MNRICVTAKQYVQFIENLHFGNTSENDDKDLIDWFDQSKTYFDTEIIVFNYFLSRALEQYLKKGRNDCSKIIEFVYEKENDMYLTIEEFDFHFINNMMTRSFPNTNNSLEDDLMEMPFSLYE